MSNNRPLVTEKQKKMAGVKGSGDYSADDEDVTPLRLLRHELGGRFDGEVWLRQHRRQLCARRVPDVVDEPV